MSLLSQLTQSHARLERKLGELNTHVGDLVEQLDPGARAESLRQACERTHALLREHRAHEHGFDELAERVLGPDLEELEELTERAGQLHQLLDDLLADADALAEADDNNGDEDAPSAQLDELREHMRQLNQAFQTYSEAERTFLARYTSVLMPGATSDG